MGLKDYFRKNREATKESPSIPMSGSYWVDIENMCRNHIPKTMAFFRRLPGFGPAQEWSAILDWADAKYSQLVQPDSLQKLILHAEKILANSKTEKLSLPEPIQIMDQWFVHATVFPSESDSAFLNCCRNRRFENYAEDCLSALRLVTPHWPDVRYANWILLLNPPFNASIHLFTFWNVPDRIHWLMKASGGDPPMVAEAPQILPVDLLQDDPSDFLLRLRMQQFEAFQSRTSKSK